VTETVEVSADRCVTVDCIGAGNGFPVFLLHGTPGSRVGPMPRASVLYRLGVRLISYDRPGYGGSDRHEGRRVADAAWDVLAIADELGLKEFGVIGRSGGGPHALACAANIPENRLRSVAVLVSLAPHNAEKLDWLDGMTNSNVAEYEHMLGGFDEVVADLTERATRIYENPESLLHELNPELTTADRRVVGDVGIRTQLIETYREALRNGPYGWVDDVLAFRHPWGFDLKDIQLPVLLWHGEDDVFSPVSHTHYLAAKIPHAQVEVESGAAHFDALPILPKLLAGMVSAYA
jgi:pimeloyl-ACP methyl ester carboxylesterase